MNALQPGPRWKNFGRMLAPLRENSARQARIGLIFVLLASALYGSLFVDRGWVPHDEGTIALGAERFLAGEMPHRDYDEAYTGGLTALHAIAFRTLGTNLLSLRLVLFLFFLPFVAALYGIAVRLVSPAVAVLVTLLCVAWSVPNYFASLPSWYNLFFATFGGLALIRHLEDGRARWLFLAGLFAGVSVLFKIVGLYFIAAVLFFLAYRENALWTARRSAGERRITSFLVVKAVGCAAFLAALIYLLRQRLSLMDVFHFILPGTAIVGILVGSEWKHGGGRFGERSAGLLRLVGPFLLGVVLPVGLFLVPYMMTGSLEDLVRGVFLLPQKQIATATLELPPLWALLPAVPYALLLLFPQSISQRLERRSLAVSLVLGATLLLAFSPEIYKTIWLSARSSAPIATLVGCVVLARGHGASDSFDRKRQQTFLLLCLTALVSLVQFPFSAPIYFCYVAPLAVLAITSIVAADDRAPRSLHLKVLVFYLLFAVVFLNSGYIFNLGYRYERYVADGRLDLERGGLRLPENEAGKYEYLVAAIEERSGGRDIYAGPDSPEVYFLSGRRNPTRSFFEFLGEFRTRPESLLPLLKRRDIRLVVLNRSPHFSPRPNLNVVLALRERFPNWAFIGEFLLMWRD